MSCPIVPEEAPLPSLRQLQTAAKDPFYSLSQMMHRGLSHFTGRGLPTSGNLSLLIKSRTLLGHHPSSPKQTEKSFETGLVNLMIVGIEEEILLLFWTLS
jgi:hypothetical protein